MAAAAGTPRKPELVCPAGSLRALTIAVDAGVDAVYMGLRDAPDARKFAGLNFDLAATREGIAYARASGRKVLTALNTFADARDLVMEGDTEYGLMLKNTLDAVGPLVPEFLRRR